MGEPQSNPALFFAGLTYPSDSVEVVKEGESYSKTFVVDAQFKAIERYSCVLEIQDGDRQSNLALLHKFSINEALAHDPTLRLLTEVYDSMSALPKVVVKNNHNEALAINIPAVTRATASRHYFVNRAGPNLVTPVMVVTVIPDVSVTNHVIAAEMPFSINIPFLYSQIVATRAFGDSIIKRNPNDELFHWRQYRRPDPDAMDAGLRLLNMALGNLVAIARSKGSLIRALGEPDPVLKGPLGEQLTAILLGANYGSNPSPSGGDAAAQILLLNSKPYNTTDPLPVGFVFVAFDSWAAVFKRIHYAIEKENGDSRKAVTHLARDIYLSILTTYTGHTAVREQGERVRANGFTINKASVSTAGVHHCSLVDTGTDAVAKLRLRLGKSIPPEMIREYSLVAAFNVNVVGNANGDSGKFLPVTRAETINLDPSKDFFAQLRVMPLVVPESFSNASRHSKVTWHATTLRGEPVDARRVVNTPTSLTFDVLWPLTVKSFVGGDAIAFGVPFADTGSVRVPLAMSVNEIYNYARSKNGGNPTKPVQFVLMGFLEEAEDPLGLDRQIAYEAVRRVGTVSAALVAKISEQDNAVGVHKNPFVSRPIVGLALVNVGIATTHPRADGALEAARAEYNLPDDVASRVRTSLAAINSNKDAYEQTIKDILRYRLQCVAYVKKVLLASAEDSNPALIGNLFDALDDKQLEGSTVGDRNVLVWSETRLYPPFPASVENLGVLADNSRASVARRAATITWLERLTKTYGDAPIDELVLDTWRVDRDTMVSNFLSDASNYALCVAMVDERNAITTAKSEHSRFTDAVFLLNSMGNLRTAITNAGASPSQGSSGDVIEALDTQSQGDKESDDDYAYRRQVAAELTLQFEYLDRIRARYIPNDRICAELPLGVVKENAEAILSNPSIYTVTASDRKNLAKILSVNPPKDSTIMRQAREHLSDTLMAYMEQRLRHPGSMDAVNTGKLKPRGGRGGRKGGKGGKGGKDTSSTPGDSSFELPPPSSDDLRADSIKLPAVSAEVYKAAQAAQSAVITAIDTARTLVRSALENETKAIDFMREISLTSNIIVDALVTQTQLFSVSQSRAFNDMADTKYRIEIAGGSLTPLDVSEPVYIATRQYMALVKSGAAGKPDEIQASALSIVRDKQDELRRTYSIQISLDSNSMVIKRLSDLIEAIVTAPADTLFDNLFHDPVNEPNSLYTEFYTKVRLVERVFEADIALSQQRLNYAVSEVSNLLARLQSIGSVAPKNLIDEGIALVNRIITPNTGLLPKATTAAQRFARVTRKIVEETNSSVLKTRPGVSKRPSTLLLEIRDGFTAGRASDYATIRGLNDERAVIATRSVEAERDLLAFRSKAGDILAKASGQPLSSPMSELLAVVEKHKAHFGKPTALMAESYSKFTTTLDAGIVKYFLLDAWTSPEALDTIEATYKSAPKSFTSEAEEVFVVMALRDLGDLSRARAKYTSRLEFLGYQLVGDAVGQFAANTSADVRSAFIDKCAADTGAYFDALIRIARETISRVLKGKLLSTRNLAQEYPTPRAVEEMISGELHRVFTAEMARESKRLFGEYTDGLRIASSTALNTTLLWNSGGGAPRNDGSSPAYIIPNQNTIEALIGWKTGALDALRAQMFLNLPKDTIKSVSELAVVRAVSAEQEKHDHVPMPLLVSLAIRLGHINVDFLLKDMPQPELLGTHYATIVSMFGLYCRLVLSAVEFAMKHTVEEDNGPTLLGIDIAKPSDAARAIVCRLCQAWLSDNDGEDIVAQARPSISSADAKSIAESLRIIFDASLESKLNAHLNGATFERFKNRVGWRVVSAKTADNAKNLEAYMRGRAKDFCRSEVFDLVGGDALFYGILGLFGVTPNDLITENLRLLRNVMELGVDAPLLTARSNRFAGKSANTGLWKALSRPERFDSPQDAILPIATAPAVAAFMVYDDVRSTYEEDTHEPKRIMFYGYKQVQRLCGRIQSLGDAIKDTKVQEKGGSAASQATKDATIQSIQRLVDDTVTKARALWEPQPGDYSLAESAYARVVAFLAKAEVFERNITESFARVASKVEDHLNNAGRPGGGGGVPAPVVSTAPKRVQR